MALQLGDTAPDFEADTSEDMIELHDGIGDPWAVLSSHPSPRLTPTSAASL